MRRNWRGEKRNFCGDWTSFTTNSTKLRDVAQFRMNNLLDVALSHGGYTHIRFETPAAQRNFVYKNVGDGRPRGALHARRDYGGVGVSQADRPDPDFPPKERGLGAARDKGLCSRLVRYVAGSKVALEL